MNAHDQQEIWTAFLLVLVCAFGALVMTQQCGCCPAVPSAEDVAHTASHAATLERCKAEARAVGKDGGLEHWEACKRDAGITR